MQRELFHWSAIHNDAGDEPIERLKPIHTLSEDVNPQVENFYRCDDISCQAPDRKDLVSVKENESHTKYQTRHLTSSVNEVSALFQDKYLKVKIGWSMFASLHPADVLLNSKIPWNMRLCKYHKKVAIALEVLDKIFAVPTISAYSHKVPVTFLCDKVQQECWSNKCASCSDGRGFQRRYKPGEYDNKPVTWCVWKQTESERLTKVVEDGTIADLFEHVKTLLPQFFEHSFVKRKQSEQYQIERNHIAEPLNTAKALIQVNFSKNYICKFQNEVQSAPGSMLSFTQLCWCQIT